MSKGLNIDDIAHDTHRDLHHLSVGKGASEEFTRGVFDSILKRLATGEPVTIRGFGVFEAKVFKGRKLNTPLMKGGGVTFEDQLVIRFRQSQAGKAAVNAMAAETKGKKGKPKAAAATEGAGDEGEAAEPKAKASGGKAKPEGGKAAKKAEKAPKDTKAEPDEDAEDEKPAPKKTAEKPKKAEKKPAKAAEPDDDEADDDDSDDEE